MLGDRYRVSYIGQLKCTWHLYVAGHFIPWVNLFVSNPFQVVSTLINLFQLRSTFFYLVLTKKKVPFQAEIGMSGWVCDNNPFITHTKSAKNKNLIFINAWAIYFVKIAFIYITCVIPIAVLWKAHVLAYYSSSYWHCSCWNKEVLEL